MESELKPKFPVCREDREDPPALQLMHFLGAKDRGALSTGRGDRNCWGVGKTYQQGVRTLSTVVFKQALSAK